MKKCLLIFSMFLVLVSSIEVYGGETDKRADTHLRNIWNEMIESLNQKDIEKALTYFTYTSRFRYRKQFELLKDKLPEIFRSFRNIEPVYIREKEAKYRIKIEDKGEPRTGYIWFRKDILGRWKIDKF